MGLGYSIWISNIPLIILEAIIIVGLLLIYYQCRKEKDNNSFLAMMGVFFIVNSIFIYTTFKYVPRPESIGEYKNFGIAVLFVVLGIVELVTALANNFYKKSKKLLD